MVLLVLAQVSRELSSMFCVMSRRSSLSPMTAVCLLVFLLG